MSSGKTPLIRKYTIGTYHGCEAKSVSLTSSSKEIKSSTLGGSSMTEGWDWVRNSSSSVPLMVFVGLMSKSYSYMCMIHLDHLLCNSV
jgi:hypothetical protein